MKPARILYFAVKEAAIQFASALATEVGEAIGQRIGRKINPEGYEDEPEPEKEKKQ